MRAFLVGLVFLAAVFLLSLAGLLLAPFILALAWVLRIVLGVCLVIFAIWVLGKFIIFVWEKMREKDVKKDDGDKA